MSVSFQHSCPAANSKVYTTMGATASDLLQILIPSIPTFAPGVGKTVIMDVPRYFHSGFLRTIEMACINIFALLPGADAEKIEFMP